MDPLTGISKGFAFIYFDNFNSSDKCIEQMNGQIFSNQAIKVEYAYKNSKKERHGDEAERFLAKNS